MDSYKIICKICFRHDYYNDNMCRCFDLIPTDETKNLLSRLWILFRRININEWAFIGLDNMINYPSEELSFKLKILDSSCLFFTEENDLLANKHRGESVLSVNLGGMDIQNSNNNVIIREFNTRKVYWEYILTPRQKRSYNSLEIKCGDETLKFGQPYPDNVTNPQYYICRSENPVSLKDSYNFHLDLIDNTEYGPRFLCRNLPFPQPWQMNQKDLIQQRVYF